MDRSTVCVACGGHRPVAPAHGRCSERSYDRNRARGRSPRPSAPVDEDQDYNDVPKLDHRTAPSFWAERDWVIDSPPIPRARPGDGRHDQLGSFQTALLGRITPASTAADRSARWTILP